MDNANVFKGFKTSAPSFELFPEVEDHPFVLEAWGYGDSFHVPGGEPKTEAIPGWKLPPWEDPTPEIWMQFRSAEGKGTMFYHAHWLGYRPGSSLTAEEIENGYTQQAHYFDKNDNPIGAVYACAKNKKGELVRLTDEANTAKARNIFNTICAGLGIPPGSEIEALDDAVKNESVILATVTHSTFGADENGKPRKKAEMGSWKNPARVTVSETSDDWEEGK